MRGRYGQDLLNTTLLWVGVALSLVNTFFRSYIAYALLCVLLALVTFRFLSRNVYKRRAENEKNVKLLNAVRGWIKLQKDRFRDRKTHIYRKCPHCKAVLRLPRVKGAAASRGVTCPRCSKHFDVRT